MKYQSLDDPNGGISTELVAKIKGSLVLMTKSFLIKKVEHLFS